MEICTASPRNRLAYLLQVEGVEVQAGSSSLEQLGAHLRSVLNSKRLDGLLVTLQMVATQRGYQRDTKACKLRY